MTRNGTALEWNRLQAFVDRAEQGLGEHFSEGSARVERGWVRRILRIWLPTAFGAAAIVGSLGWSYADTANREEAWRLLAAEKSAFADEKEHQVARLKAIAVKYLHRAESIRDETDKPGDAIVACRIVGDIIEEGFVDDTLLLEHYDLTRETLCVTLMRFIWPETMPDHVVTALREQESFDVSARRSD